MNLNEPVSGRQFAKMVGQAESALRKAVGRSSIVEGKTPDGKYIPAIAAREWGKEILPEFGGPKTTTSKPSISPVVKNPPRFRKDKPTATTAEEVVREVMDEKLPPVSRDDLDAEDFDDEETEIDDKIQKPEAERRTAILKAKILQIALKEKQGMVVDRNKINGVLFSYGQEVRVQFEGLSDRVIDAMRATDSRHEQKRILEEEIHATLTALADIPTRPL